MQDLNAGGILFIALGWGLIVFLNVYCFRHLFREKSDRMVAPGEIEEELDKLHK